MGKGDARYQTLGQLHERRKQVARLIEFFEALVAEGRKSRRKVFLILDNLGVHHCKPVKA